MPGQNSEERREEVLKLIGEINDSWTSGLFDNLEDLFHDGMVIAKPGAGRMGVGKKACINSYRDFCRRADIVDFEESDFVVDVWDDTAVVSYRFKLRYEIDGEEYQDNGHDLLVLARKDVGWRVLWRAVL